MTPGYWQIGMLCMGDLFKKINTIDAKSLRLTREVIKKK